MTQSELAQRAGCSVGTLRKIEAGDRRPSKQLARLLARGLEITKDDQEIFVRVARGELNLERLGDDLLGSTPPLPTIASLVQAQQDLPPGTAPQASSRVNRIPYQTTPLIGREYELAAVERLFVDPQCRLLTLTGPGGIGKTRLAIEIATRNQGAFPGGVFYVPLAAITSSAKITPTIADALDFGFSGPGEPKAQLLNFIAYQCTQTALLVLDNLEHLLPQSDQAEDHEGLVDLISEMLERAPNLKILGTSRERMNLHGEWAYELHGLSVPPAEVSGRLESYDAASLFIDHARRTRADFQVSSAERAALVEICRLVEGVPLAIELAAAWVEVLSCQEIAQEIKANLDFLSTSMRGIPERHRSIRATFDHSWKLLSTEERQGLSQLAVFQGGFDRAAASQVAGASLTRLASLCAKSLVERKASRRYDLHELIRQYACDHLHEEPGYLATYDRHCQHYLGLLCEHGLDLKRTAQQEALRLLTDEIDNIRAAWAYAIDIRKYDLIEAASRALGWYYEAAGLYLEGVEQFEYLKGSLPTSAADSNVQRLLGLALTNKGLLYFRKGEFDLAEQQYAESLPILRAGGDQALLADALVFSGIIQHLKGAYGRARAYLEDGLALASASDEPWIAAYARYNLGYIDSLMGRYQEGYEQMMAGLAAFRTLGDPHYIALGLNFAVPAMIKLGFYAEAQANLRESISLCERARNRWGMGTAYRYLGLVLLAGGDFEAAQNHFRKSLEIFGQDLIGWHIARTLTYLGDALLMSGDLTGARAQYLQALRLSLAANSIPIALDALVGLGEVHTQTGQPEDALGVFTLITAHPGSEVETRNRAAQRAAELERSLDPTRANAARELAAVLTLEELAREMLGSAGEVG